MITTAGNGIANPSNPSATLGEALATIGNPIALASNPFAEVGKTFAIHKNVVAGGGNDPAAEGSNPPKPFTAGICLNYLESGVCL